MIAELQSSVVELLEAFRQEVAQADLPAGLLAPLAVKPYGGELMDYNRLVAVVPTVYVELEAGTLRPKSERTGAVSGAHTPGLLCCARNYAGPGATAHDGARLMSWCVAAFQHAGLKVGPYQVGEITYQRVVSDSKVWVGEMPVQLTRGKHAAPVPVAR